VVLDAGRFHHVEELFCLAPMDRRARAFAFALRDSLEKEP
jgi:hypothetical protein